MSFFAFSSAVFVPCVSFARRYRVSLEFQFAVFLSTTRSPSRSSRVVRTVLLFTLIASINCLEGDGKGASIFDETILCQFLDFSFSLSMASNPFTCFLQYVKSNVKDHQLYQKTSFARSTSHGYLFLIFWRVFAHDVIDGLSDGSGARAPLLLGRLLENLTTTTWLPQKLLLKIP